MDKKSLKSPIIQPKEHSEFVVVPRSQIKFDHDDVEELEVQYRKALDQAKTERKDVSESAVRAAVEKDYFSKDSVKIPITLSPPQVADNIREHINHYKATDIRRRLRRGKVAIVSKAGGSIPKPHPVWPIVRGLKLRFNATAATSMSTGAITVDDILGAIGVTGRVANTSVTCLATSFKINAVRIWLGPSGSAAANAQVTWLAAIDDHEPDFVEENEISINYQGTPGCVVSRPPKGSTASMWTRDTSTGTDLVCIIVASTTGSVVEVDLDFTLPTTVASSNSITVTTSAVGVFYRLALNKTNGSGSLVPLGYQTTS